MTDEVDGVVILSKLEIARFRLPEIPLPTHCLIHVCLKYGRTPLLVLDSSIGDWALVEAGSCKSRSNTQSKY
ncbi:hypothetical protein DPMN_047548 [Dreissena polymorpha]|uniref:Uncharacterized protein n=1 Tax=Dreissena polymorpha TaxID=45954 RepID=A0A9D4D9X0_DREPO|nr:hypothetical protein DPMN_047548 [Dreissena polymorpha]